MKKIKQITLWLMIVMLFAVNSRCFASGAAEESALETETLILEE